MRRLTWWFVPVVLVVLGVAPAATADTYTPPPGPAPAGTTPGAAPQLDIRIERDDADRAEATDLGVYHNVTLTDKVTGQAPERVFQVVAYTISSAGEQSQFFDCNHRATTDAQVARGIYYCTVFVDRGGNYEFNVSVQASPGAGVPPVEVARAKSSFELVTDQVYTATKGLNVNTSATAVAVLWFHVLVAGIWFLCAAALAALALPSLRRRLSSFGLYRLEKRFDLLAKFTWSTTATVVGTGVYLIANETAYATPSSVSKFDTLLDLPFAQPYFLALGIKLGLYLFMILSIIPLVRNARRHLEVGLGAARSVHRSTVTPAESPFAQGEGAVLTASVRAPAAEVEAPPRVEVTTLWSRVAVIVMVVGAVGLSLCVTLLKYFHQVIEAL